MQERWEVFRVTYVIARFLALNGVASIEVRRQTFRSCFQHSTDLTSHVPPTQPAAS